MKEKTLATIITIIVYTFAIVGFTRLITWLI